jgi:lipoate---protein ligase
VAEGWPIEVLRDGIAERLAARPDGKRSVVVYDIARPTLVLGSSQPDDAVDWDRARERDVEVVHRRSGGSAVLVEPGAALWVDVTIPAGDPWWDNDVGRAFHWLGAVWTEVLIAGGILARWHDGAMQRTPWSPWVCFAGLGPGEVTVGGRKAIGLSQRRTREGALFQCCAALRWEPERLLDLLTLPDADRTRAAAEISGFATGLGPDIDLITGLLDALSRR